MGKWMVRIWWISGDYIFGPYIGTQEEAIEEAKKEALTIFTENIKYCNYRAYLDE